MSKRAGTHLFAQRNGFKYCYVTQFNLILAICLHRVNGQTLLFNTLMGYFLVLPRWDNMDLGVMTIKRVLKIRQNSRT